MTVCDKVCQEVASISSLLSCDGRQSALAEDTPGGGGLCSRWSGRLWAGTGAPRKALCAPSFPPTPRTRVARVWVACSAARQKEEGRKEGGREEGSQKPGAGGVSRGRMFREE